MPLRFELAGRIAAVPPLEPTIGMSSLVAEKSVKLQPLQVTDGLRRVGFRALSLNITVSNHRPKSSRKHRVCGAYAMDAGEIEFAADTSFTAAHSSSILPSLS